MPPPIFPYLYGWSVKKQPTFATIMRSPRSGREVDRYQNLFPLWEFELRIETLKDETQNAVPYSPFSGFQQFRQVSEIFVAAAGQFGRFYFEDTSDCSRSAQPLGVGDGVETEFVFVRTVASGSDNGIVFTEPVGGINLTGHTLSVYVDGVLVNPNDYSVAADLRTLIFDSPVAGGGVVTADFFYYYLCRFITDDMPFEQFYWSRWEVPSIKFRSVNPYGSLVPGYFVGNPTRPLPEPQPPVVPVCDVLNPDIFAVCMGPNGRLWNGVPSNIPSDSPLGVLSIWFMNELTAAISDTVFLIATVTSNVNTNPEVILQFDPQRLMIGGVPSSARPKAPLTTWAGVADGTWAHALFSWDTTTNTLQVAINGVLQVLNTDYTQANISMTSVPYSSIAQFGPCALESYNNPTNTAQRSAYSDVFFGIPITFFDISIASNREKFYNAGPVDVSGSPSVPLGVAPFICLHGSQSDYQTNYGNGGNMVALNTPDVANLNVSPY